MILYIFMVVETLSKSSWMIIPYYPVIVNINQKVNSWLMLYYPANVDKC